MGIVRASDDSCNNAIIRRQRLLPSTGRNPLCGSADRYFFLPTSTNTMRMWRMNALTPASRNNTIGFICQVSVSSRTMALRFYQHPLAGGSPGRSRLRRRPRTWGPTERAREGGQGRQARCRGGSEDPSLPILPGRRCPHACQPACDNRFRLRDDPLHQFLTGRDVVDRRCCMKICGWGGVARTSLDPPQEPHYRDEVEGPSQVQDEVPRCELAGLQPSPRPTRRCDGVVDIGGDRCLDGPPEHVHVGGSTLFSCVAYRGSTRMVSMGGTAWISMPRRWCTDPAPSVSDDRPPGQ